MRPSPSRYGYPFLRRSGPIETRALASLVALRNLYPFLRRSGPIETRTIISFLRFMALSIHFCEEVAQLKLCLAMMGYPSASTIHFCEEVAQLKLVVYVVVVSPKISYPFLRRSGPIETLWSLQPAPPGERLSISAKKWPNWNELPVAQNRYGGGSIHFCEEVAQLKPNTGQFKIIASTHLSISAKKWPNWNVLLISTDGRQIFLSISAKKWPNWNKEWIRSYFFCFIFYPFLLRSGPIETLGKLLSLDRQEVYPFLLRSGPIETPAEFGQRYPPATYPFLLRSGPIETLGPKNKPSGPFLSIHFC